jgi:geranylgeranyl diphosphate synthase type I
MDIHKFKTAFYTIPGPLQYGAILAGVAEHDPRYKALEEYGIPVGIAFQLRDDELGMFSQQEKFGKPIYSDLRQGKNTVLFAKAFENANEEQLKVLNVMHGNPDVKEEDLHVINEILIETGALKYSEDLSRTLVEEGKAHINKITDNKNYKELLDLVADFVVTRDK